MIVGLGYVFLIACAAVYAVYCWRVVRLAQTETDRVTRLASLDNDTRHTQAVARYEAVVDKLAKKVEKIEAQANAGVLGQGARRAG